MYYAAKDLHFQTDLTNFAITMKITIKIYHLFTVKTERWKETNVFVYRREPKSPRTDHRLSRLLFRSTSHNNTPFTYILPSTKGAT